MQHIAEEVNVILDATHGKTKTEMEDDPILSRAIIRSLEIIGEATKKIDDEFRADHPHIEWKKMARTRDKLIHDYFGVDYDIVWDIIENKLPTLKDYVDEIINEQ
ncbi:DUF86 domain-containing protein [Chitinophaga sp. SYP-B3965]|uniref:HepT-like ribonuclease domain-containing protein n=1 Tax=Chitinophaga sp. SYP-B3965 TaxID=2663120 RepID=UPI001C12B587|nr:DUF86 domain-containing protein [Chitinophaga sp. SYP-B3965]